MAFPAATRSNYQRDGMICRDGKSFCPFSLSLIGAGWFLVALFVGETELLSILPGPAAQITLVGLTIGLLTAFWCSRSFRAWVEQLDLRTLILLHLARFAGIYFLVMNQRGELPERFALTAGWGDLVVAVGALILVLFPAMRSSTRVVMVWNTVGLIDILLVVAIASGLSLSDRDSMSALTRLPLSFLPTMLVPLIISTHVIILARSLKRNEPTHQDEREQTLISA